VGDLRGFVKCRNWFRL